MENARVAPIEGEADRAASREQVATAKAEGRALAIDRAKGLGILLVVWGHLATVATPGLPVWFHISVTVIYSFHMPLFMYLSGFVFFLSSSHLRFWKAPAKQVWSRFDRLMIPCIAFAVITVVGKYVVYSANPDPYLAYTPALEVIGDSLQRTITNDQGNPVLSIWYLIVLFVYSIVTPALFRVLPKPAAGLVVLGFALWLFSLPDAFYIERIGHYFVFFAIGGFVALHRERLVPLIRRFYLPSLILLAVLCYVMLAQPYALLVCGIASLPAIHGLFSRKFWENDRIFLFLGRNSMAIYLINSIAIGVGQIIYTQFLPYQGSWFLIYSPIMVLVGILVPVLIRRMLGIHRAFAPVKKYID